jgi:undecaprenyl-diphosphatase
MNEIILAIILGIVEGVTEFIPVSSTGHLILFGDFLEFKGAKAQTFQVFIQIGAILAVVFLYWERFVALIPFGKKDSAAVTGFEGVSGILKLLLTSAPALVLGWLFYGFIKENLFNSSSVAAALVLGGLLMILVECRLEKVIKTELREITYWHSFWVGVFQCLALWPGMSRSGSTIIGARLLNCSRKLSAEFSFLAAVPIMFAAVAYDLYKSWNSLETADLWLFGVGALVSFVTAIFAVKFFIAILQRCTLKIFGVYRIILGSLIIILFGLM